MRAQYDGSEGAKTFRRDGSCALREVKVCHAGKRGIQVGSGEESEAWIPVCTGMTESESTSSRQILNPACDRGVQLYRRGAGLKFLVDPQQEKRPDDGADPPCAFTGLIPTDSLNDIRRENLTGNAEQSRHDEAHIFFAGHDEFGNDADDKADDNGHQKSKHDCLLVPFLLDAASYLKKRVGVKYFNT